MKKYFILIASLALALTACKGKATDMSKELNEEETEQLSADEEEKRFLESTGDITTEPQNYDNEAVGEDTSTNQEIIDGDDFNPKDGYKLPEEGEGSTQPTPSEKK